MSNLSSAEAHTHADSGADHGSFKSYLLGFLLSIALTLIPFLAVMNPSWVSVTTAIVLMIITGVGQILVQLICFLHLDSSSEKRWNVIALAFAVMVLSILIGGTIWIMYNLDINMMVRS